MARGNDINLSVGLDPNSTLERDLMMQARRAEKRINKSFSRVSRNEGLGRFPRLNREVSEFQNSLEASNARVVAFGASTAVLFGVQKAFRDIVGETVRVEKQLTSIQTLLNQTPQGLKRFQAQLFDIARDTGATFETVARGAEELARQGLGAEETSRRLADALKLVRFTGEDVTKIISTLTASINGFANEVLDTTKIVNKLSVVESSFAVSATDLSEAITRSASAASDANASFDEFIALITAAQQITARGGPVIGNGLKTIFTRIQRPQVLEQLREFGIEVDGAATGVEALKIVAKEFEGLTSAAQSQVGELIGSVFQINTLRAILRDLSSEYSIFNSALETSLGATDQAIARNEALSKTLSAIGNELGQTVAELFASLGEGALLDPFKEILRLLQSSIGVFATLSKESEAFQLILKGIGAAVVPAIAAAMVAVFNILKQTVGFAGKAFTNLLGLDKAAQKIASTQEVINNLKRTENQETLRTLNSVSTVAEKQKLITQILRDQVNLQRAARVEAVAYSKMMFGGGPLQKGIFSRVSSTGMPVPRARGYVPNAASGAVDQAIMRERFDIARGVGGAGKSAKPKVIKNFSFGGGKTGTAVANTHEYIVKNFMGSGGDAIFNKDMVRSMGMPEGAKKINFASGNLISRGITKEIGKGFFGRAFLSSSRSGNKKLITKSFKDPSYLPEEFIDHRILARTLNPHLSNSGIEILEPYGTLKRSIKRGYIGKKYAPNVFENIDFTSPTGKGTGIFGATNVSSSIYSGINNLIYDAYDTSGIRKSGIRPNFDVHSKNFSINEEGIDFINKLQKRLNNPNKANYYLDKLVNHNPKRLMSLFRRAGGKASVFDPSSSGAGYNTITYQRFARQSGIPLAGGFVPNFSSGNITTGVSQQQMLDLAIDAKNKRRMFSLEWLSKEGKLYKGTYLMTGGISNKLANRKGAPTHFYHSGVPDDKKRIPIFNLDGYKKELDFLRANGEPLDSVNKWEAYTKNIKSPLVKNIREIRTGGKIYRASRGFLPSDFEDSYSDLMTGPEIKNIRTRDLRAALNKLKRGSGGDINERISSLTPRQRNAIVIAGKAKPPIYQKLPTRQKKAVAQYANIIGNPMIAREQVLQQRLQSLEALPQEQANTILAQTPMRPQQGGVPQEGIGRVKYNYRVSEFEKGRGGLLESDMRQQVKLATSREVKRISGFNTPRDLMSSAKTPLEKSQAANIISDIRSRVERDLMTKQMQNLQNKRISARQSGMLMSAKNEIGMLRARESDQLSPLARKILTKDSVRNMVSETYGRDYASLEAEARLDPSFRRELTAARKKSFEIVNESINKEISDVSVDLMERKLTEIKSKGLTKKLGFAGIFRKGIDRETNVEFDRAIKSASTPQARNAAMRMKEEFTTARREQRLAGMRNTAMIGAFALPMIGGMLAQNESSGVSRVAGGALQGAGAGLSAAFLTKNPFLIAGGAIVGAGLGAANEVSKGRPENRADRMQEALAKLSGEFQNSINTANQYVQTQAKLNDLLSSGNFNQQQIFELVEQLSTLSSSFSAEGMGFEIQRRLLDPSKDASGRIRSIGEEFALIQREVNSRVARESIAAITRQGAGKGIFSRDNFRKFSSEIASAIVTGADFAADGGGQRLTDLGRILDKDIESSEKVREAFEALGFETDQTNNIIRAASNNYGFLVSVLNDVNKNGKELSDILKRTNQVSRRAQNQAEIARRISESFSIRQDRLNFEEIRSGFNASVSSAINASVLSTMQSSGNFSANQIIDRGFRNQLVDIEKQNMSEMRRAEGDFAKAFQEQFKEAPNREEFFNILNNLAEGVITFEQAVEAARDTGKLTAEQNVELARLRRESITRLTEISSNTKEAKIQAEIQRRTSQINRRNEQMRGLFGGDVLRNRADPALSRQIGNQIVLGGRGAFSRPAFGTERERADEARRERARGLLNLRDQIGEDMFRRVVRGTGLEGAIEQEEQDEKARNIVNQAADLFSNIDGSGIEFARLRRRMGSEHLRMQEAGYSEEEISSRLSGIIGGYLDDPQIQSNMSSDQRDQLTVVKRLLAEGGNLALKDLADVAPDPVDPKKEGGLISALGTFLSSNSPFIQDLGENLKGHVDKLKEVFEDKNTSLSLEERRTSFILKTDSFQNTVGRTLEEIRGEILPELSSNQTSSNFNLWQKLRGFVPQEDIDKMSRAAYRSRVENDNRQFLNMIGQEAGLEGDELHRFAFRNATRSFEIINELYNNMENGLIDRASMDRVFSTLPESERSIFEQVFGNLSPSRESRDLQIQSESLLSKLDETISNSESIKGQITELYNQLNMASSEEKVDEAKRQINDLKDELRITHETLKELIREYKDMKSGDSEGGGSASINNTFDININIENIDEFEQIQETLVAKVENLTKRLGSMDASARMNIRFPSNVSMPT